MKKILSLVLIISLCLISFTACKKEKDVRTDFFEDLNKLQNFETGDISLEFHINAPKESEELNALAEDITTSTENQDIFIKVDASIQNTNPVKARANIYYKDNKESDYSELTDIIINDKDYYVNLNTLKNFVVNAEFLNGVEGVDEIRTLLGNIELNYLKITNEELLEMTDTYVTAGETTITTEAEKVNYDLTKDLLTKVFLNTFKEIENGYEETLITYNDETYEINLNAELIKDIYKKIDVIVNRDIDNIANELLTANYGADIPEDILTKKDELISEIKTEANKLSTTEISETANIKYQFKFYEDKDYNQGVQLISATEEDTTVEISLLTINTVNSETIVIPEKTTTLEELIQTIMTSMFGASIN